MILKLDNAFFFLFFFLPVILMFNYFIYLRGRGVSGCFRALFRFELQACYHPNIVIFVGGPGFSEFFFVNKKDPLPVKSLLENTMGNPFFDFLNYDQNSSKII